MSENAVNSDLCWATFESGVRALEKAYRDCESRLGRPATNVEVCEELGITIRDLCGRLEKYRKLSIGNVKEIESQEEGDSERLVKYVPFTQLDEEMCYVFAHAEFRNSLNRAINALPKNERLVVRLRYRQKLSLAEIASLIGISENSVAQIHTTAMLRIRPKLIELPVRQVKPDLLPTESSPAA
jgi:RNA polymerase sigma factor for flagellar operon FliA